MENIFSQLAHLLEEELNSYVKVQDQFSVEQYVKGELMRAGNRLQQQEIEEELLGGMTEEDKQTIIDEDLRQDCNDAMAADAEEMADEDHISTLTKD